MQRLAREHVQRVLHEQETLNSELEKKKKQLDSWSRELNKREVLTEREKQKLDEEKKRVMMNTSLYLGVMEANATNLFVDNCFYFCYNIQITVELYSFVFILSSPTFY